MLNSCNNELGPHFFATHRRVRLWRGAVSLVVGLSVIVASSCRKAEPDEVVTPPRSEPSFGGSLGAGVGGSSGGGQSGTGAGGIPETDDSGTSAKPVECNSAVTILEPPFTKAKLIESAANCAMSHYCRFAGHAQALRDSTKAVARERSEQNASVAKNAWISAISSWEEAELFNFGPAAVSGASGGPGGQDLRDLIYSWPLQARCRVDEQTVSRFYSTPDFFGSPTTSYVNGRSLAALEYLLFYEATDNGCNQFSAINASGAWRAIPVDELKTRKGEYAVAAAEDVLSNAVALVNAWEPSKGDFRGQLLTAGAGSTVFQNEQHALNAINSGLFYVEAQLKDDKLGIPLGLSVDCPAARCPDRVESPYARVSTQNLQANLRAFRRLFQGCAEDNTGIGFDDWLTEVGRGDLADRMLAALSNAEAAVANLDPPLEQSIVMFPERVQAVYDAIKALSDPLKTEFLTSLNLERPGPAQGDND